MATRLRALTLDADGLSGSLAAAPAEFSDAARQRPLVLSLPAPDGSFQRFTVVEAPVMEAGLAAKHPHIKTYAGRGLDDPTATLRMSSSQLGLHVSVRSRSGHWYVEPLYQGDTSLYASYRRSDVAKRPAAFTEPPMMQPLLSLERGRYRASDQVKVLGAGFAANAVVTITVRAAGDDAMRQSLVATATADGTVRASFAADPWRAAGRYEVTASDGRVSGVSDYQVVPDAEPLNVAVGSQLRTYRLAMVSTPSYARDFGAANVTAAKVTLMTRVNQVYEDDLSIRMLLIAGTDALNLNTSAQATEPNGPCGGAACFTPVQLRSCSSLSTRQNIIVAGLLAGAGNFDVGHLVLGSPGGGLAGFGVGLSGKAGACTGLSSPVGDVFAIDYVAHELGHQFGAYHTFNGIVSSCGGNRSGISSVEPGSGSSIMSYGGICGDDDLQPNIDAYFSQRSFDEITNYIGGVERILNEGQRAALTGFTVNGRQFQLRYNGSNSAAIVRGGNFTAAGVKTAIEGIAGWPAGGTVAITELSDNAFSIVFGGTLAGSDVPNLQLVNCTGGCVGYISDIVKGGATTRGGSVTATGNTPPTVTAPAAFTIPLRTPFALTGSATDADGDTVTYMWEQNDRGDSVGTSLINAVKVNGPLFSQFGTRVVLDSSIYNPPGQQHLSTDPTRVFPDMPQILVNNTNAESGHCGTVSGEPTVAQIDCFSEFLPTADYVGFSDVNANPPRLNMRLTVRDGRGGVNSADTVVTLAPGAGPFLVTAPNTTVTLDGATATTVTWNVANTSAAPVSTANVRISLSVDGGATWPYVLAASTANNGSRSVLLPNLATKQARVRVAAVGNIFFDVSNANFSIRLTGDADGSGAVDCADLAAVRTSLGTRTGQPGFNPAADVNGDGTVNRRDIAYVDQRLPSGTMCPA